MVFGFLPLLIMSFMMQRIEEPDHTFIVWVVYIISVTAFTLGTAILIYNEFIEVKNKGCKKYIRDPSNVYQWIMIFFSISLVL